MADGLTRETSLEVIARNLLFLSLANHHTVPRLLIFTQGVTVVGYDIYCVDTIFIQKLTC